MTKTRILFLSALLLALPLALQLLTTPPASACFDKDRTNCECPDNEEGANATCSIKARDCKMSCDFGGECRYECSSCDFDTSGGPGCPKSGSGGTCEPEGGCYRDLQCVPCGY